MPEGSRRGPQNNHAACGQLGTSGLPGCGNSYTAAPALGLQAAPHSQCCPPWATLGSGLRHNASLDPSISPSLSL